MLERIQRRMALIISRYRTISGIAIGVIVSLINAYRLMVEKTSRARGEDINTKKLISK